MKKFFIIFCLSLPVLSYAQITTTPPIAPITVINPGAIKQVPPAIQKLYKQDKICLDKHYAKNGKSNVVDIKIRIEIIRSLNNFQSLSSGYCPDDKKNPYISCLMTKEVKDQLNQLLKKSPKTFDSFIKHKHDLNDREVGEFRKFYLNLSRP